MTYNMTGIEAANNFGELLIAMDPVTNYIFIPIVLVSFWIILTLLLIRRSSTSDSIFASSLVTMFVTFLFAVMGVVSVSVAVIFAVIAGVAAVGSYLNNR